MKYLLASLAFLPILLAGLIVAIPHTVALSWRLSLELVAKKTGQ